MNEKIQINTQDFNQLAKRLTDMEVYLNHATDVIRAMIDATRDHLEIIQDEDAISKAA